MATPGESSQPSPGGAPPSSSGEQAPGLTPPEMSEVDLDEGFSMGLSLGDMPCTQGLMGMGPELWKTRCGLVPHVWQVPGNQEKRARCMDGFT